MRGEEKKKKYKEKSELNRTDSSGTITSKLTVANKFSLISFTTTLRLLVLCCMALPRMPPLGGTNVKAPVLGLRTLTGLRENGNTDDWNSCLFSGRMSCTHVKMSRPATRQATLIRTSTLTRTQTRTNGGRHKQTHRYAGK